MTLDEFVEELKGDINRFQMHWRDQAAKHPKNWPMEFDADNEGGWWEQFQAFVDQGR